MSEGILLVNLGSPSEPSIAAIKKYLSEFLMDPYVLQMPYLLRAMLVYGIILPFRPQKTLKNYLSIWTNQGSPLVVETEKLKNKLQKKFKDIPVEFAMRYGDPSFEAALDAFRKKNISKIKVIPLYPQYAISTSVTTQARFEFLNNKIYNQYFQFTYLKDFYNCPGFIDAFADQIQTALTGKSWDKLLISFHGLPKSHLGDKVNAINCVYGDCCDVMNENNQDCYRAQCFETARAITKKLNIPKEKYEVGFQSRLTRGWIEPFTDKIIEQYPKNGIERVAVVCPSFVSDCLETLEEVKIGEKQRFLQHGGKEFHYIPCINDNDLWVNNLTQIIHSIP